MEQMQRHPMFQKLEISIRQLCDFMDITPQGFYQRRRNKQKELLREELIIQRVLKIREKMPKIGGRKLYYLLKEDITQPALGMGRDKFFALLKKNALLVRPTKQYVRTTNSKHRYQVYSNLIKDLLIEVVNSVTVADITYIRVGKGFCYLFLVTDVYSRTIKGYCLSRTLEAQGAVEALDMSLKDVTHTAGMIHHSDRGVQYCSDEYVNLLHSKGIKISMGEAGNPYENAIAERVNGILKYEFMLNTRFDNYQQAQQAVVEAIETYNNLRPHLSLNYLTPKQKYAA